MADNSKKIPAIEFDGFWGKKAQSLDDKGRTTIPSKFLNFIKKAGEGYAVLITKDTDYCLRVYLPSGWRNFLESLADAPPGDPTVKALQDVLIPNCEPIDVNKKTGRITIPSHLREYAGLKQDAKVLFIGNGSVEFFKIWNDQRWESHESKSIKVVRSDEQSLARAGIKY
jgi:transcriptional regulator MraZ